MTFTPEVLLSILDRSCERFADGLIFLEFKQVMNTAVSNSKY